MICSRYVLLQFQDCSEGVLNMFKNILRIILELLKFLKCSLIVIETVGELFRTRDSVNPKDAPRRCTAVEGLC